MQTTRRPAAHLRLAPAERGDGREHIHDLHHEIADSVIESYYLLLCLLQGQITGGVGARFLAQSWGHDTAQGKENHLS